MSDPDAIEGVPLPEATGRLVGHAAVFEAVASRIGSGRLPGAILLHGPPGIGKATLAFALAREILSRTGDEDAHRVAEQVAAGVHPNLAVLRRRPREGRGFYTVIRVEDVRALRDDLHMTRGRAGHRVAVLDAVDDCNPSAANALLKTLEEPPAETSFLIVSHRPGALLPTIRSRCHAFALRPLPDEDVAEIVTALRPEADPDTVALAVARAGGRPRRALEALALAPDGALAALGAWLADPSGQPQSAHLGLADALAAGGQGAELSFAREALADWIAAEARDAALSRGERIRLASAGELWEKAGALFAETDALNLDMRQTLVSVFDAILRHARTTQPDGPDPR